MTVFSKPVVKVAVAPPEPGTPIYDYKKTFVAAGKVGLMAAAGVLLADQSGLTNFVIVHLPSQYAAVGALLLTTGLAALKNWLSNKNKTA
jgi:hypothetical protein